MAVKVFEVVDNVSVFLLSSCFELLMKKNQI